MDIYNVMTCFHSRVRLVCHVLLRVLGLGLRNLLDRGDRICNIQ